MAGFLGPYLKPRSRSTYVHCKVQIPRHIFLLVANQLLLVNSSFSSHTSHVFTIPQVGVLFETVLYRGLSFFVSPLVLMSTLPNLELPGKTMSMKDVQFSLACGRVCVWLS